MISVGSQNHMLSKEGDSDGEFGFRRSLERLISVDPDPLSKEILARRFPRTCAFVETDCVHPGQFKSGY
jgi:hypothetical protein